MKHELVVLAAKRTAIGTFQGQFKNQSATDLGVIAAKAALEVAKVSGEEISQSIVGNVCPFSSPDGIYLARHIGLKAGVKIDSGAISVNRLCGSGFEALVQASMWVDAGPVLAGGAENMSMAPLILRNTREGWRFAKPPQGIDSLWESLNDPYAKMSMAETAELLAKDFGITREECDAWAYKSHQGATKAEAEGKFKDEIVAVEIDGKSFSVDEHIRRDANLEKMAKLKPVFGGVTTAANASGMNDAASMLVVSNMTYAKEWMKRTGLKPLAKIVGSHAVGCDPKRMGIGPVQACKRLSAELGWNLKDLEYIEINEAFAAQILAVKKELGLSAEQLNPHGSGISLGHPLGATGARISAHIAHSLSKGEFKRAIGSACIGGGQGIAVAFENFS